MTYDYIIIGGGPTGLTLATYLSKKNKILLIEREKELGGSHRVKYKDGYFTEHGPRIYIGNYVNTKKVLNDMDISWNEIFTKQNVDFGSIIKKSLRIFSIAEMAILSVAFILQNIINKKISVYDFTVKYNFSKESKHFMDRLCRMTDGGGIKRYTMYKFLQLMNQNIFYDIYQPKIPNDKKLFKLWKEKINGDIVLNANIENITESNIMINGKMYNFKRCILAIPPYDIINLIQGTEIENLYGRIDKLKEFEKKTRYYRSITIIMHWNNKEKLDMPINFDTEWGLYTNVVSNNTKLNNLTMSIIITKINKRSNYINKTPDECNKEELVDEVFRQLKKIKPSLVFPDHVTFDEDHKKNNKWIQDSYQFMNTANIFLPNETEYGNIFTCGTHNGNSSYNFTSMESAITNALVLYNKLERPQNRIKIDEILTVNHVLFIIIFIIILFKKIKY